MIYSLYPLLKVVSGISLHPTISQWALVLVDTVIGSMKTGFQYIANQHKTVYYNNNGQMLYGQQHLNGHWYLFDTVTFLMKTGFQYIANQHKMFTTITTGKCFMAFKKSKAKHITSILKLELVFN
ncbi:hypothetical protein EQK34_16710 [Lacticaseibacillus paracasei]|nr:hypothetical protein EQK34_16710 [Lacticaseibacillus paracasei]